MWRHEAIVSMLLEEIGGLPADDSRALHRARRRGVLVVLLDWLAVLLLVVLHDGSSLQITLSGGEQTVFTLGLLAVAVHSGYRLGQLAKLKAIERLCDEFEERRGQ